MVNLLAVGESSVGLGIVQTITTAIKDMLTGVGSGMVDFFDSCFKTTTGSMTTFATVALTMLGVGFALGFIKFMVSKIRG